MSVLREGELTEEDGTETDDPSPGPKSMTALSMLELLAEEADTANATPDEAVCGVDNESVESLGDSSERLAIQEDVFELEGLDEVRRS